MSIPGNPKVPWQFLPLPPDYLHPLTFTRPDVILHVYDLWSAGKHNELSFREFSLPDATKIPSFAIMGVRDCMKFLDGWHISETDVAILQGVESLSDLEPSFWDFLAGLRITGRVKGIPDGTVMGVGRIELSSKIREMYGDKQVPLGLLNIESAAAEIALVSEGLAAILDFAIEYSMRLFKDKLAGSPPMFYESEREIHPYWARLAAGIEYVINVQNPLMTPSKRAWLWIDESRDSQLLARAEEVAPLVRIAGYDPMMLVRREIPV
ncbi:MAG TPA: hypothetical protein VIK39_04095 [Candidatus Angelobacter sp.]